jgi:hypothetical protein
MLDIVNKYWIRRESWREINLSRTDKYEVRPNLDVQHFVPQQTPGNWNKVPHKRGRAFQDEIETTINNNEYWLNPLPTSNLCSVLTAEKECEDEEHNA